MKKKTTFHQWLHSIQLMLGGSVVCLFLFSYLPAKTTSQNNKERTKPFQNQLVRQESDSQNIPVKNSDSTPSEGLDATCPEADFEVDAGDDQNICNGDTATLQGSTNIEVQNQALLYEAKDMADFNEWGIYNPTTWQDDWVWNKVNSNQAGGTAPEWVYYSSNYPPSNPDPNYEAYIYSPLIVGTGNENLKLSFKHKLVHAGQEGYPYSVSIDVSGDLVNWTTLTEISPVTASIPAQLEELDIDANFANTNFHIRFRVAGEDFGINNWYIDDITVTGTPIAEPIYSWTASVGANPVPNNVLNPMVSPTLTTTYTLTVNYNGQTCFDTVTIEVEDCNPPCLESLSLAISHSPVCYEEAFQLLATIVPDPGVDMADLSFDWVGPNGFTSNQQNPIVNDVGPQTSGTYTLTVSHSNGWCIEEESVEVLAILCHSYINSSLRNRVIKD